MSASSGSWFPVTDESAAEIARAYSIACTASASYRTQVEGSRTLATLAHLYPDLMGEFPNLPWPRAQIDALKGEFIE